ncbi:MAG TPA: acyltransferase [Nitrospiraceae bacterium]|nr:acyltransferase [Nitrospiraceae bacterium]
MELGEILSLRRLPALDGLRAIAVFTVIIYHFGFESVPGDLGVSAFFVLSGFLITWLLLKEHDRTGRISIRNFYIRRLLRIAPAYYGFLILVYVEEQVRGYHWDWSLLLSGLLYIVNYYNAFNGHHNTAIAHAWSLGVEQQFYLVWPFILCICMRSGLVAASWLIAGIIVLVAAWRSFLYLGLGAPPSYVYNAFETRLDCLAVGSLVALCASWSKFQTLAADLSRLPVLPLCTLGLLLYSRTGGSEAYHYSVGFTVDSILLAIFIMQILIIGQRGVWSWVNHPVMVYLGLISYSLYLYHLLGLGIGRRVASVSWPVEFAVSMLVCVLLASASYWIIERPFLALKGRWKTGV